MRLPGHRSFLLVFLLFILLLPGIAASFCFEEAGRLYGISPLLLWGIAASESNFNPGAVHWNSDGSYDFGVMQINSSWALTIGPSLWSSLGDACTNIKVGAWVLAQCFARYGYTWEGVGCYNASSQAKRFKYAGRVWGNIKRFAPATAMENVGKESR